MKLTFDAENLSVEEQKALYLWLKAKFDPDSPSILTDAYLQREEMLNKRLREFEFSSKASVVIGAMRLRRVRDLFDVKRSEIKKLIRGGYRVCDEIEAKIAEMGLTFKMEK